MVLPTNWVGRFQSARLKRRQTRASARQIFPATKILIADGDKELLERLGDDFMEIGFAVYLAKTGEKALRISQASSDTIDILVSDAQLLTGREESASVTGIELARQIRVRKPDTKIILMSEANLECMVCGMGWEFIRKPFAGDQLMQKVKDLLHEDLAAAANRS
jgi:DNA-binding response OmpR family regulator